MRRIILSGALLLLITAASGGGYSDTVYATKLGKKYHLEDCSSVKNSKTKKSMSVSQAHAKKLQPCKRCSPPESSR